MNGTHFPSASTWSPLFLLRVSVVNMSESETPLPPKVAERLLIDLWPSVAGDRAIERVLATTAGRAQLARMVAEASPQAAVECYFLDAYQLGLAERACEEDAARPKPENLAWRCSADLVESPMSGESPHYDVVALPLSSRGDAELTREQLQQAYQSLRADGLLLASTDNPRDVWLHEMTQSLGGKVRRYGPSEGCEDGAVYAVRATGPLKRPRDFTAEFVFRDGERLFPAVTRPGVFSHRRVDPGARRLMEAMTVTAGMRVLDIGCGWGTVAVAAAARAEDVTVAALDSSARAVACTTLNAQRNGVGDRVTALCEPAGPDVIESPGTFDVALANPPYYADFRIAEAFVDAAHAALRPGGDLLVVTKLPQWYRERLPERFADVAEVLVKNYTVFRTTKR